MSKTICNKSLFEHAFKFVLFSSILASFSACKKDGQDPPPSPVIDLPAEESYYFPGESIAVKAEVLSYAGFSHLELYLNEAFVLETEHWTIDTLLEIQLPAEATHTIKVIACDLQNHCNESSVNFQVLSPQGEAEDEESFDGDHKGWFFSGWSPTNSEGYDDSQSMRSTSSQAISITRKHFDETGSVSFHVKNGLGTLVFLVDGKVKSRWFGKEDWGEYIYTVPQGEHVFKWIASVEDTYLDKISFTPGVEKHCPGEHFEGGIIFYLDSTAQHGLIAATDDGKYNGRFEIPWGCHGLAITAGNRAQSYTNGAANTLAIVRSCDWEQIAARYCNLLIVSEDGHAWDDWYLPALYELKTLYTNRDKLEGLGGQYYWTSTSFSTTAASVIDFQDGRHHGAHRNIPNVTGPVSAAIHVRPIRRF